MASDDTAAKLDRQTEARLKEIEAEVRQQQTLTSELRPIASLQELYDDNDQSHFLRGCVYLTNHYSHVRCIRGDGNCYYRAFLYRLTELLYQEAGTQQQQQQQRLTEGQRILDWLKTTSWNQVLASGYSEFAVETFFEEVVELIQDLIVDRKRSAQDLHAALNEENGLSDYCTWYLRVLTATFLKSDPDRFLPFMEEQHMDIVQYCQREVEPMGKECEMVSVLALAEFFGVQVTVEYLDGHTLVHDRLARHVFGPESAKLQIHVLYRPGHYDILYPSNDST